MNGQGEREETDKRRRRRHGRSIKVGGEAGSTGETGGGGGGNEKTDGGGEGMRGRRNSGAVAGKGGDRGVGRGGNADNDGGRNGVHGRGAADPWRLGVGGMRGRGRGGGGRGRGGEGAERRGVVGRGGERGAAGRERGRGGMGVMSVRSRSHTVERRRGEREEGEGGRQEGNGRTSHSTGRDGAQKGRGLGYKTLEELSKKDPSVVAITLSSHPALQDVLLDTDMRQDLVHLLCLVLSKAFKARMDKGSRQHLAGIIKDSGFLRTTLPHYLAGMGSESNQVRRAKYPQDLENIVAILSEVKRGWMDLYMSTCITSHLPFLNI